MTRFLSFGDLIDLAAKMQNESVNNDVLSSLIQVYDPSTGKYRPVKFGMGAADYCLHLEQQGEADRAADVTEECGPYDLILSI